MTKVTELYGTVPADPPEDFRPGAQTDPENSVCPYCGHGMGDCWEWVKPEPDVNTCQNCGKEYRVWAEADVTYCTEPLDPEEEEVGLGGHNLMEEADK